MSTLERRLQLLLDQERYERVWQRFLDLTATPQPGPAETLEEIKASLDERFTTSW
jgi:hypothetical protein